MYVCNLSLDLEQMDVVKYAQQLVWNSNKFPSYDDVMVEINEICERNTITNMETKTSTDNIRKQPDLHPTISIPRTISKSIKPTNKKNCAGLRKQQ